VVNFDGFKCLTILDSIGAQMDRKETIEIECSYMKALANGLYINIMRAAEILEANNQKSNIDKGRLGPKHEMEIRQIAVVEINRYTGILLSGDGACERIKNNYKGVHNKEMDCSKCIAVTNFTKATDSYSSTFNK